MGRLAAPRSVPRRAGVRAGLLVLLLLPGTPARASEPLWTELQQGGRVILMRHAVTTPGVGDPPGMRLDDCATQRNLTDEGRRQARQVGEALRAHGVTATRVLSSPWCRCFETARLAFGPTAVEGSPVLGNLFGRPEREAGQVRQLRALVGGWRGPGTLVLVSHGSTIAALTGVMPAPAEMVVVTPQGPEAFAVAGRLTAHSP